MVNDQSHNENKESVSAPKKAVIAFAIGAFLIAVLFYFYKKTQAELTDPVTTQDSFQGPADLSSAVQITCQDSAKKVFMLPSCSDKEAEFLKNAANCINVYYVLDANSENTTAEGNFGDLSLHIAKCYSETEKLNSKAVEWLKKINAQYDWDVYMGPISCDSKSTLSAQIENYSEDHHFKCYKTSDLQSLISELKNSKFQILKSLLATNEVAHQGIIEADVSCPETLVHIEKNLNKILSTPFEVTEPKLESGAPDDVFIELTRNNERLLNLQFKIKAEGCLHFQSLLAPSSETE